MKPIQAATFALLVAILASLSFSGCATHAQTAGHHCAQCSCKMMEDDPANPGKCKMCGHDAKAHAGETAPQSGEKHVH